MIKSRLIELYFAVEKSDLHKLEEFVASPFFNKSPQILSLFAYLRKIHRKEGFSDIDKNKVWKLIFRDEVYNDKKMRELVSKSIMLLEDFFYYTNIKKHRISYYDSLLSIFNNNNLEKSYTTHLNRLEKFFEEKNNIDLLYYQEYIQMLMQKNNNLIVSPEKNIDNILENLNSLKDHITVYNYLLLLNYLHIARSLRSSLNLDEISDDRTLKRIKEYIESNKDHVVSTHPLLYSFYLILITYDNLDDPENYYNLKDFVIARLEEFSDDQKAYFYHNLHNYAMIMLSRGNPDFRAEAFNIIEYFEKETVIFDNESFGYLDFLNIVKLGIDQERKEWVERFIERYEDKIVYQFRVSTYSYAMALVHFAKKEYDKALDCLVKVEFHDYYFYLNAKTLQIKIYFEIKEVEGIISIIDSNRHFFKKKLHLPEYLEAQYKKFFSYVGRLIKTEPWKKDKIEEIYFEIERDDMFLNKKWLLDKTKELSI